MNSIVIFHEIELVFAFGEGKRKMNEVIIAIDTLSDTADAANNQNISRISINHTAYLHI